MLSQLAHWDRASPGDVPGGELRLGPDVEHDHIAGPEAGRELLAAQRLEAVPVAEVGCCQRLDPSHVLSGDIPQGSPSLADPVAGQHVDDASALTSGPQQAGAGHRPQVMRGVGNALSDLGGDLLDRALALGKEVDDLGPVPVAERLGDRSQRPEERILRRPVAHTASRLDQLYSKYHLNIGSARSIFKGKFE